MNSEKTILDLWLTPISRLAIVVLHDLNVFENINNELAITCLPLERASKATNFLISQQLVYKTDRGITLAKGTSSYLMKNSPYYNDQLFSIIRKNNHYHKIRSYFLGDTQTLGPLKEKWQEEHDLKYLLNFQKTMNSLSGPVLEYFSKNKIFQNFSSLLDLGCGLATFSKRLRMINSKIDITAADLKVVIDHIPNKDKYPINYRTCDFFDSTSEFKVDCVFLSEILHDWDEPLALKVLEFTRKSLNKFGKIIISECLLSENGCSPATIVTYDLLMRFNHRGRQYKLSEIKKMALSIGFKNTKVIDSYGHHSLIEIS